MTTHDTVRPGLAGGLVANIAEGLRLAFFLPVDVRRLHTRPADYALLVLWSLALWISAGMLHAGPEAQFDPAAFPSALGAITLLLAACVLIAGIAQRLDAFPALAVALSASDLAYEAAGLAMLALPLEDPRLAVPLWLGLLVWMWLVSLRAVAAVLGATARALAGGGLVLAFAIAFFALVYPRAEFWHVPPDRMAGNSPALAGERLFHLQGQLIERALAAIPPGREGEPELYFVGFAPDGSQDVFLREMRYAKTLFEETLGAAGRSTVLASGETALAEFPVATATNLGRVLARVGERMNRDEDLLVLYLSAHGSENFELSAWQPPLAILPVNPTMLARQLADAGVRWKLIIVSACYSGGFIEPLKDANTIVLTAARADRTSFGCAHGRDFTYFGEALLRDALPNERAFLAAFEAAKKAVDGRERAEGLAASEPQSWIGPALARRLSLYERPRAP